MEEKTMPRFESIRNSARIFGVPEYALRKLQAEGRLPGIQIGKKYRVNQDALAELLTKGETDGKK